MTWPVAIADEAELEEVMTRPDQALREDLAAVPGDLLVLGAAGKMGPTLCRLAKRADPKDTLRPPRPGQAGPQAGEGRPSRRAGEEALRDPSRVPTDRRAIRRGGFRAWGR